MVKRSIIICFFLLPFAGQSVALAQQSLAYRGDEPFPAVPVLGTSTEAPLQLERNAFDSALRSPASAAGELSPILLQDQVSRGSGSGVWRGLVTGLGVGAAAALGVLVWVSAGAGLDLEEVADFYVPVVAVVGAAGGAVLGAARDGGAATAATGQRTAGRVPALPGLGLAAAMPF